jgi:hypothetical protein
MLRLRTFSLKMIAAQTNLLDLTKRHHNAINSGANVSKHVMNYFAADAQVLFVPTGQLAKGHFEIEQMLATFSNQAHAIQSEKVHENNLDSFECRFRDPSSSRVYFKYYSLGHA